MRILKGLEPADVFGYFEDICSIPHGSGNTRAISDHLVSFAASHGLRYRREECGNVVIFKGPSPGYEDAPTVIIQGHMDMITVKEDGCPLDMEKEGLDICVDGDWIYAKGTSLGADDGVAVAYALAILADDPLPHPALEAVFTVDEEIGLLGASNLNADDLKGRILLNIDSTDEGIFLTGCAGGATAKAILEHESIKAPGVVYELKITGLKGGHSGMEIVHERANANVLFGRLIAKISEDIPVSAGNIEGGEKDNAVARILQADIAVDPQYAEAFEDISDRIADVIKAEYSFSDPDIDISIKRKAAGSGCALPEESKSARGTGTFMSPEDTRKLGQLISMLPDGVIKRVPHDPGAVQTSLNMGIMKSDEKSTRITFCVRSSVESEKAWLLERLRLITESMGGRFSVSGIYPAWEYKKDSVIQTVIAKAYRDVTGKEPGFEMIHAGVECGIFCGKIKGLDCISYGPDMADIHTTNERLSISSSERTYKMTCRTLELLKDCRIAD